MLSPKKSRLNFSNRHLKINPFQNLVNPGFKIFVSGRAIWNSFPQLNKFKEEKNWMKNKNAM